MQDLYKQNGTEHQSNMDNNYTFKEQSYIQSVSEARRYI